MTVTVESIRWLSAEAQEAVVTLSDGAYRCDAFCHPCALSPAEPIDSCLDAMDCRSCVVEPQGTFHIRQLAGFAHEVRATLIDHIHRLVAVGDFRIRIDDLPGDARVGDTLGFTCARLDL